MGMMPRRQAASRRHVDSRATSRSPLIPILLVMGALVVVFFFYSRSGGFRSSNSVTHVQGDYSCTMEVQNTIPLLKKAYGDASHKVLHVGPDTCSVVSMLLKDEETKAWGIEPYDTEDADNQCKSLVQKGIVRVAGQNHSR